MRGWSERRPSPAALIRIRVNFTSSTRFWRSFFPLVHQICEKHVFHGSLLFKWSGKGKAEPILLMSHHDVVEANGDWEHPPFSGELDEQGRLWGRGTVDTKASLFCILTAVEEKIREGFVAGGRRVHRQRLHGGIQRRGRASDGGLAEGAGRPSEVPHRRGRHDPGRAHRRREGNLRHGGRAGKGLRRPEIYRPRQGRPRLRARPEHASGTGWDSSWRRWRKNLPLPAGSARRCWKCSAA